MSQAVATSVQKIIDLAAKKIGTLGQGQTLSGEDVQDCFDLLNFMLAEWSEQPACVYHTKTVSFPSTGAVSYTVGAGGDVDTDYPLRLESAYFRSNNLDYPLEIVHSQADYNRLPIKNMPSFPTYAYLETSYPLAKVYFWPVPQSIYTMFISFLQPLAQFTQLTDEVDLRGAYFNALVNNLAIQIAPIFGIEAPGSLIRMALTSKRTIEKANTQIQRARVPQDLTRPGRFNIYSNRSN